MNGPTDKRIIESRRILQNPYAYLGGDDHFEAELPSRIPDVHDARLALNNQWAYLDADGGYSEFDPAIHSPRPSLPFISINELLGRKRKGDQFSKREIQGISRKLLRHIWANRAAIWPGRDDIDAHEALSPGLALELLGYRVNVEESLGRHTVGSETFEVAGIVDSSEESVRISRVFSRDVQNFTTGHELGHAVLHQSIGLHRDRPLDGGGDRTGRDRIEIEADHFAATFLMPEKLVSAAFKRHFLTDHFVIDDDTAHAFGVSRDALEMRCRSTHDLATLLADCETYNGRHFVSLARQFRVSIKAMAIRLDELKLIA
jgi:Zn-dependent peptidase ImmA (M78 family)